MKAKNPAPERLGREAPTLAHLLIVLLLSGALIGLSWIAYFKWQLFH